MYRSSWCEIDLNQYRTNILELRQIVQPSKMLQVLKSNAYGHGVGRMGVEAQALGVDMVGVATISEADEALKAGVTIPILSMCAMDHEEIDYCVANGVDFMAWRQDQFDRASAAASQFERAPRIHLEIDTGFARTGVTPEDLPALLSSMSAEQRTYVVGMMTHYWAGALENNENVGVSVAVFKDCVAQVQALGIDPILHSANSSNAMRVPETRFDMVRMGMASFGLRSSKFVQLPEAVAPIMSWKATVTNTKFLRAGTGVSYGWEYVAEQDHRIATIGVGYTDGLRRNPPYVNTGLIGGIETPMLGRLNMDQCMLRVPDGVSCEVGDEVVLMGRQGNAEITAYDLAERWLTNHYDVVIGINQRVPRRYV